MCTHQLSLFATEDELIAQPPELSSDFPHQQPLHVRLGVGAAATRELRSLQIVLHKVMVTAGTRGGLLRLYP